MQLHIYDANNFVRFQLQHDLGGMALPGFYTRIQTSPHVNIVVWDGFNANARRRELYPDYKANRPIVREDIFASLGHLREVLKHSKAIQVQVPGYEADDVVAALARRYADQGHNVVIYANDFDYMALTTHPNIICGANPKALVAPGNVRTFKTWVGDTSDNIKGVPYYGKRAWETARRLNEIGCMRRAAQLAADAPTVRDKFEATIKKITLRPKQRAWLMENTILFGTFWKIVGFMTVPPNLIDEHTTLGVNDPVAAQGKLREFMWIQ